MICLLLTGPKSVLDFSTKEEWNGEEAQREDIICKLPEAEIALAQGGAVADARRRIEVTERSY